MSGFTNASSMVSEGLVAMKCNKAAFTAAERRFKYKLQSPPVATDQIYERIILDAWVLSNDICILTSFIPLQVDSVDFSFLYEDLGTNKKGKPNDIEIVANDVVCKVQIDDRLVQLCSPILGRVLETNEKLVADPTILSSHPSSNGFIAILSSTVPSLIDRCGINVLRRYNRGELSRLCYSWVKGNCFRGDACKFFHPSTESDLSLSVAGIEEECDEVVLSSENDMNE